MPDSRARGGSHLPDYSSRVSFALIELLVVITIVAILAVAVILAVNPAELLKQARDITRLSDLDTLNHALWFYQVDAALSTGASPGRRININCPLDLRKCEGEKQSCHGGMPGTLLGSNYFLTVR